MPYRLWTEREDNQHLAFRLHRLPSVGDVVENNCRLIEVLFARTSIESFFECEIRALFAR
jgi:hypothetical protein